MFGLFWGPGSFLRKESLLGLCEGGMVERILMLGLLVLFLRNGSVVIVAAKRQRIRKGHHTSIPFLNRLFLGKKHVLFIRATPQWYFPVIGFPGTPVLPRCLLREMPHADPDEDGGF